MHAVQRIVGISSHWSLGGVSRELGERRLGSGGASNIVIFRNLHIILKAIVDSL